MSLFHTEKGWFKISEIILGILNFPQILFLQRRQIGSLADDWTLIKFIIWGHRLFIPDVNGFPGEFQLWGQEILNLSNQASYKKVTQVSFCS